MCRCSNSNGVYTGSAEVQCGVLSTDASLELLLRAGGCEQLLDAPPPAALEAVELCGRLPLTLALAGGIIEELGSTWQSQLVPLLREVVSFPGRISEARSVALQVLLNMVLAERGRAARGAGRRAAGENTWDGAHTITAGDSRWRGSAGEVFGRHASPANQIPGSYSQPAVAALLHQVQKARTRA